MRAVDQHSLPLYQLYYVKVNPKIRARTNKQTITHMMIIIFFCGKKRKEGNYKINTEHDAKLAIFY